MPTVAQMYNIISSKTDFQRSDAEIFNAIDAAGFAVFADILKESAGFFIKNDATTIILTPPGNPGGQQSFLLPTDLSVLLHVAERPVSSSNVNWMTMEPEGIGPSVTDVGSVSLWSFSPFANYGYGLSQFRYYGPYLSSSQTQAGQDNAVQTMALSVSPQIDVPRNLQLIYTAKWVQIFDAATEIMLPEEATHAILNWALADILKASNDSRAEGAYAVAERQNAKMLTWARARQMQTQPYTEPYLS